MSILQKVGLGVVAVIVAIGGAFFVSQKVTVDNASNDQLVFNIDDTEYTVEPNAQIEVSLMPGEHTVTIAGQEIGKFKKEYFDYGSLLNPTKSTYVLESIPYGSVPDSWMDANYKDVTIAGKVFNGPFVGIDDLYFAKKFPLNFLQKDGYEWDYGLDEHEPEEATVPKGQSYTVNVKIYRQPAFETMYAEDYL